MSLLEEIRQYQPQNEQEGVDKAVMLDFYQKFPSNALFRENRIAHFSSSAFILNPTFTKVLFAHHNILNTWAWLGGHADGEENLYKVALREAEEEAGAYALTPLSKNIQGLDILPVPSHMKNGSFVNSHLHLSIAYLFVCDDKLPIRAKLDENSAVGWLPVEDFTSDLFSQNDCLLYQKLFAKAKSL